MRSGTSVIIQNGTTLVHTPYEVLTNQNSWKLGVFGRKLGVFSRKLGVFAGSWGYVAGSWGYLVGSWGIWPEVGGT